MFLQLLVTQEELQIHTSVNQREKEKLQKVITSLTLHSREREKEYEKLKTLMKGIINTFGVNYMFSMFRSRLFKKISLTYPKCFNANKSK